MTPHPPIDPMQHQRSAFPTNSLIEAARGPVLLITLGLLFAADQMDRMAFSQSWPALLIVYGLMRLAAYVGTRSL